MLANFFNSETFCRTHDVSFSYVSSVTYAEGFCQRVHRDVAIFPIKFLAFSGFTQLSPWLPLPGRRFLLVFLRFLFKIPYLLYQIFLLQKLFRKIKPDVLHINNGGYPGAQSARAAAIAAKISGVPKVLMVVNNLARDYTHHSRWIDLLLDRIVVSSVDVFITGSAFAAQKLKIVLRLPSDKVKSIHNGIDIRERTSTIFQTRQRLGFSDFNGTIFGVVALLIERKGHQVLLEAVLDLVNTQILDNNQFAVLVEGHGPLRDRLVNYVLSNGLEKYVFFVGNEFNIIDFMSAIDVLILPSVNNEDLPNVISEAMSLGKPVIATKIAGIPEQVAHGKTGLLVDPANPKQLARAIHQLVIYPNIRSSFAINALVRFKSHFKSQIAIQRYSDVYKFLASS